MLRSIIFSFTLGIIKIVAEPLELDSIRVKLMEPNGISVKDLNLFPPHAKADVFRLSRVEKTLSNPFYLDTVVKDILLRTGIYSLNASSPLSPDSIWPLLDVSISKSIQPPKIMDDGTTQRDTLVKFFKDIREGLTAQVAGLSKAELDFLFHETSELFLQEETDTNRTAIEQEWDRLAAEKKTHKIMELAGKLDLAALVRASRAAHELEVYTLASLKKNGVKRTRLNLKRASDSFKDENFFVHENGRVKSLHRDQKFQELKTGIWIDSGSNNNYRLASSRKPGTFLMIVDVSGDDHYFSNDSLHFGSANMGIELLADLAGNDHYAGKNFAFAASLYGYASLFDAAGHDSYAVRCASLGFGFFGLGILEDKVGNDTYAASLMSIGAGSTKGAGLLLDRSGNDQYLAKPTFKDDLRYQDHNIHMLQGFATGFAPDYSGGIGLLRDGSGNDLYVADIFGQGSAYWYALGLLVDEGGNDTYQAHQYAQGAGVHMALGALVDLEGNDHYFSKGVSQGCGHDLGFGLLSDKRGDDFYLATDMSQGAGSANGLGVLQDSHGNDIYESVNPDMTLGHADMRRNRGSWGFFWDGDGLDRYPFRLTDLKPFPQKERGAWQVYNGKTKGNGFGVDK